MFSRRRVSITLSIFKWTASLVSFCLMMVAVSWTCMYLGGDVVISGTFPNVTDKCTVPPFVTLVPTGYTEIAVTTKPFTTVTKSHSEREETLKVIFTKSDPFINRTIPVPDKVSSIGGPGDKFSILGPFMTDILSMRPDKTTSMLISTDLRSIPTIPTYFKSTIIDPYNIVGSTKPMTNTTIFSHLGHDTVGLTKPTTKTAISSHLGPDTVGLTKPTTKTTISSHLGPDTVGLTKPTTKTAISSHLGPDTVGLTKPMMETTISSHLGPDTVGLTKPTTKTAMSSHLGPDTVGLTKPTTKTAMSSHLGPDTVGLTKPTTKTAISSHLGHDTVDLTKPTTKTAMSSHLGPDTVGLTKPTTKTAISSHLGPDTVGLTKPTTKTAISSHLGHDTVDLTKPTTKTAISSHLGPDTVGVTKPTTKTAISSHLGPDTVGLTKPTTKTALSSHLGPDTVGLTKPTTKTAISSHLGPDTVSLTKPTTKTAISSHLGPDTVGLTKPMMETTISSHLGPDTVDLTKPTTKTAISSHLGPDTVGVTKPTTKTAISSHLGPDTVGLTKPTTKTALSSHLGPDTVGLTKPTTKTAISSHLGPDTVGLTKPTTKTAISSHFGRDTVGLTKPMTETTISSHLGPDTVGVTKPTTKTAISSHPGIGTGSLTKPMTETTISSHLGPDTVGLTKPTTKTAISSHLGPDTVGLTQPTTKTAMSSHLGPDTVGLTKPTTKTAISSHLGHDYSTSMKNQTGFTRVPPISITLQLSTIDTDDILVLTQPVTQLTTPHWLGNDYSTDITRGTPRISISDNLTSAFPIPTRFNLSTSATHISPSIASTIKIKISTKPEDPIITNTTSKFIGTSRMTEPPKLKTSMAPPTSEAEDTISEESATMLTSDQIVTQPPIIMPEITEEIIISEPPSSIDGIPVATSETLREKTSEIPPYTSGSAVEISKFTRISLSMETSSIIEDIDDKFRTTPAPFTEITEKLDVLPTVESVSERTESTKSAFPTAKSTIELIHFNETVLSTASEISEETARYTTESLIGISEITGTTLMVLEKSTKTTTTDHSMIPEGTIEISKITKIDGLTSESATSEEIEKTTTTSVKIPIEASVIIDSESYETSIITLPISSASETLTKILETTERSLSSKREIETTEMTGMTPPAPEKITKTITTIYHSITPEGTTKEEITKTDETTVKIPSDLSVITAIESATSELYATSTVTLPTSSSLENITKLFETTETSLPPKSPSEILEITTTHATSMTMEETPKTPMTFPVTSEGSTLTYEIETSLATIGITASTEGSSKVYEELETTAAIIEIPEVTGTDRTIRENTTMLMGTDETGTTIERSLTTVSGTLGMIISSTESTIEISKITAIDHTTFESSTKTEIAETESLRPTSEILPNVTETSAITLIPTETTSSKLDDTSFKSTLAYSTSMMTFADSSASSPPTFESTKKGTEHVGTILPTVDILTQVSETTERTLPSSTSEILEITGSYLTSATTKETSKMTLPMISEEPTVTYEIAASLSTIGTTVASTDEISQTSEMTTETPEIVSMVPIASTSPVEISDIATTSLTSEITLESIETSEISVGTTETLQKVSESDETDFYKTGKTIAISEMTQSSLSSSKRVEEIEEIYQTVPMISTDLTQVSFDVESTLHTDDSFIALSEVTVTTLSTVESTRNVTEITEMLRTTSEGSSEVYEELETTAATIEVPEVIGTDRTIRESTTTLMGTDETGTAIETSLTTVSGTPGMIISSPESTIEISKITAIDRTTSESSTKTEIAETFPTTVKIFVDEESVITESLRPTSEILPNVTETSAITLIPTETTSSMLDDTSFKSTLAYSTSMITFADSSASSPPTFESTKQVTDHVGTILSTVDILTEVSETTERILPSRTSEILEITGSYLTSATMKETSTMTLSTIFDEPTATHEIAASLSTIGTPLASTEETSEASTLPSELTTRIPEVSSMVPMISQSPVEIPETSKTIVLSTESVVQISDTVTSSLPSEITSESIEMSEISVATTETLPKVSTTEEADLYKTGSTIAISEMIQSSLSSSKKLEEIEEIYQTVPTISTDLTQVSLDVESTLHTNDSVVALSEVTVTTLSTVESTRNVTGITEMLQTTSEGSSEVYEELESTAATIEMPEVTGTDQTISESTAKLMGIDENGTAIEMSSEMILSSPESTIEISKVTTTDHKTSESSTKTEITETLPTTVKILVDEESVITESLRPTSEILPKLNETSAVTLIPTETTSSKLYDTSFESTLAYSTSMITFADSSASSPPTFESTKQVTEHVGTILPAVDILTEVSETTERILPSSTSEILEITGTLSTSATMKETSKMTLPMISEEPPVTYEIAASLSTIGTTVASTAEISQASEMTTGTPEIVSMVPIASTSPVEIPKSSETILLSTASVAQISDTATTSLTSEVTLESIETSEISVVTTETLQKVSESDETDLYKTGRTIAISEMTQSSLSSSKRVEEIEEIYQTVPMISTDLTQVSFDVESTLQTNDSFIALSEVAVTTSPTVESTRNVTEITEMLQTTSEGPSEVYEELESTAATIEVPEVTGTDRTIRESTTTLMGTDETGTAIETSLTTVSGTPGMIISSPESTIEISKITAIDHTTSENSKKTEIAETFPTTVKIFVDEESEIIESLRPTGEILPNVTETSAITLIPTETTSSMLDDKSFERKLTNSTSMMTFADSSASVSPTFESTKKVTEHIGTISSTIDENLSTSSLISSPEWEKPFMEMSETSGTFSLTTTNEIEILANVTAILSSETTLKASELSENFDNVSYTTSDAFTNSKFMGIPSMSTSSREEIEEASATVPIISTGSTKVSRDSESPLFSNYNVGEISKTAVTVLPTVDGTITGMETDGSNLVDTVTLEEILATGETSLRTKSTHETSEITGPPLSISSQTQEIRITSEASPLTPERMTTIGEIVVTVPMTSEIFGPPLSISSQTQEIRITSEASPLTPERMTTIGEIVATVPKTSEIFGPPLSISSQTQEIRITSEASPLTPVRMTTIAEIVETVPMTSEIFGTSEISTSEINELSSATSDTPGKVSGTSENILYMNGSVFPISKFPVTFLPITPRVEKIETFSKKVSKNSTDLSIVTQDPFDKIQVLLDAIKEVFEHNHKNVSSPLYDGER